MKTIYVFRLEHNEIHLNEHSGTHMDAPAHFAKGRWRVDEIPIENFICPGVVIDISEKVCFKFFFKLAPIPLRIYTT